MMGLYQRKYLAAPKIAYLRTVIALNLSFLCLMTILYLFQGLGIWMSALFLSFALALGGLIVNRALFARPAKIQVLKNRVLGLDAGLQASRIEMIERELRPANFVVIGFAPGHACVGEARVIHTNDLISLCEATR
jgi:hypothetical protein